MTYFVLFVLAHLFVCDARFWASEEEGGGRALHYAVDTPAISPLEFESHLHGCGVRLYLDETYIFSQTHIDHVFSLVNRTYATQGLPQVFIHEIVRVSMPGLSTTATEAHQAFTQASNTDGVCAVLWLTGRLFDSNIIGLAFVGGACDCGQKKVGFVAPMRVIDAGEGFLAAVNLEAWIVGHELGHLLGADHVGSANFLMHPRLQERSPSVQPFLLHRNTREKMNSYLDQCEDTQCLKVVHSHNKLPPLPKGSHRHGDVHTSDLAIVLAFLIPFLILSVLIFI